jgi:hypothetical protein
MKRLLNAVVGLAFLGGLGFCTYKYATVEDRVKAACAEIFPGMTLSQVRVVASSTGLTASNVADNVSYVVAPETLGADFECRLSWNQGVVESTRYRGPPDL